MPNVALFNIAGEEIGKVKLSDEIFGHEVNESVLHTVVTAYLANQRQAPSLHSPALKSAAAASSPGGRRAPAVPVRVPPVLPSGLTAAWCSHPSPATTA